MELGDRAGPPGLGAARDEVGVDFDMPRGLLEAQTELIQRSGNKALSEGMTRMQGVWEEGFAQIEANLTAQAVVVQQLTDRCCMFKDRPQRLEDGHSGAAGASTLVVDEDQRSAKRRGRRRTKKAASCKEVEDGHY